MRSNYTKYILAILTILTITVYALPPSEIENESKATDAQKIRDTDTWIDANHVLMFVTNKGSFAYDQPGILGKNDGFYYPYFDANFILTGPENRTVVFAAGIWIAGIDSMTGDTFVTVAEYSDDYFPGPMSGGTFITGADTDPVYRVYKIYSDSQSLNPNLDYSQWPVSQGAPLDTSGNPLLLGEQTLWTVFNDANSATHTNDASTSLGLGIEIQHTLWASNDFGSDTLPYPIGIPVQQRGTSELVVQIEIVDRSLLTNFDYAVITGQDSILGPVWHLLRLTTGDTLLANQTTFRNENSTVTDGFLALVSYANFPIEAFEAVANGNGPLIPPSGAALNFQNFPSIDNPDDAQQVGAGHWAIHTGDTQPVGSRGSFASFLSRVFRIQNNYGANLGRNDLEWRFTGSNSNPGIGGGYAWEPFDQGLAIWVPFELWNIGRSTPDDPSDDVRLIPWMIDNSRSGTFNLESWGDPATAPRGFVVGDPATEHSASGRFNDPFTDWVYWYMPLNTSPGDAGYQEFEDSILNDAVNYSGPGTELMARTVLINWNGGEQPPFNQDLPELGTVFRIRMIDTIPVDTFDFTATPPPTILIGTESVSIYSKYKLINKSNKYYKDFFISLWFDPDLGNAGDDFVGCDTLNDIFFCYNDGQDNDYGSAPPAFGVKLVSGPPFYSFIKYLNGADPQSFRWTYQYMNGLDAASGGTPLANGTRFMHPGDPVTSTGDLDFNSSDRRMIGTFGPIDFAPNDTQQIIVKLAVGQGDNQLTSITHLREVLNNVMIPGEICCTGNRGDVNMDGFDANILDLTYLVDYIFRGGPAPSCPAEADVNFDESPPNILDLTYLVDFNFRGGQPPDPC